VGAGISLLYFSLSTGLSDPITNTRDIVAGAGGILFLVGLWTPVVGAITAIDEIWIASAQHSSQLGWIHMLLAVMSAGLAMLGPGAWSADAYLFGRKLFEVVDRTRER
jgi:putative oxidoreductase